VYLWLVAHPTVFVTHLRIHGLYVCMYVCVKSKFKSGNACYHSLQNLLSSSLLSKNLKIKIYRTVIFPVVFIGAKFGRLLRGRNIG